MAEENGTAVAEANFSDDIVSLGDQLANLTIVKAVELKNYLKEKHGIEPAAGGGVVMAAGPTEGGPGGEAAAEPTEFQVVLAGFDAAKKINVIKVAREITGLGLKEAKELVEGAPKTLPGKEAVGKEEAEEIKKKVEEGGGKVEIKPAG